MFNLYDNIKQLCTERGVSVSAMCEAVGMSKSTLSNLKNGRTETITPATARKIAVFLGVTVDDVMGQNKTAPVTEDGLQQLADDERALLNHYRGMTEADRELMRDFARRLKNGN